MHILVFQHIAIEHPGIFRDFFKEDGVRWTAVELDAGEPIPDLGDFDALWVMGGPMDTWQEDAHPWLIPEKAAIRRAVTEDKMPFLGICLGHQLLTDALGGTVGPMAEAEVGILDIRLTEDGAADPLFAGAPKTGKCLQWHGAARRSSSRRRARASWQVPQPVRFRPWRSASAPGAYNTMSS